MANRAESLNLSTTLDTTLDREEKEEDEMPAENQLVYQSTLRTSDAAAANNDELRHFIGREEFEDGVQRWKEVRYYHYYYFFIFLLPLITSLTTDKREGERERKREKERERERNQNIIIFNFL